MVGTLTNLSGVISDVGLGIGAVLEPCPVVAPGRLGKSSHRSVNHAGIMTKPSRSLQTPRPRGATPKALPFRGLRDYSVETNERTFMNGENVMKLRGHTVDDLGVESTEDESLITAESLIEEVSIDGMCGVY